MRDFTPSSSTRHHAFTLVELLTVVAIVGVLAAILIPVVGKVRSNASSAQCASQLRQIGYGLHLYLQDNNNILPRGNLAHEANKPPTALFSGQGAFFNKDPRRLQVHIGQYTDSPKATTWSTSESQMDFDPLYTWDAYESSRRGSGPTLIGNLPVMLTTGKYGAPPWGQSVLKIQTPSDAAMYTEADNYISPGGWGDSLPEKPVHGDYRNTLFFDSHVEQVDLSINLKKAPE